MHLLIEKQIGSSEASCGSGSGSNSPKLSRGLDVHARLHRTRSTDCQSRFLWKLRQQFIINDHLSQQTQRPESRTYSHSHSSGSPVGGLSPTSSYSQSPALPSSPTMQPSSGTPIGTPPISLLPPSTASLSAAARPGPQRVGGGGGGGGLQRKPSPILRRTLATPPSSPISDSSPSSSSVNYDLGGNGERVSPLNVPSPPLPLKVSQARRQSVKSPKTASPDMAEPAARPPRSPSEEVQPALLAPAISFFSAPTTALLGAVATSTDSVC